MNPLNNLLSATRLTRIIESLQYKVDVPGDLLFLSRRPVVNASDAEITARFFGRAFIADLISDDSRANTYSYGRITTETNVLPNLKIGLNLTQEQINQLVTLRTVGGPSAEVLIEQFYSKLGTNLLLGVRQRWETLIIAAYLDTFNYDRCGIKLSGVTFGTPADLKITPTTTWDQVGADPVSDILLAKQLAQVRYGVTYDRMILSTTAFNYMIATTAFQNRVRMYFNVNAASPSFSTMGLQNLNYARELAAPALGLKEIDLYDSRYWMQAPDGTISSTRFLPVNVVVLEDTGNDQDAMAMDVGNGVTTESVVAQIAPGSIIGDLPQGQFGPMAYATPVDVNMNPPGIVGWGVARSWPRKFRQQMNATLTVGTFVDTIPTGAPFPIP